MKSVAVTVLLTFLSVCLVDGGDICVSPTISGPSLLQRSHGFADTSQTFAHEPLVGLAREVDTVKRNTSIFFYHVHVPRTGGSTVANLLLADICNPMDSEFSLVDVFSNYSALCKSKCEFGLTDNELSCNPNRILTEHDTFLVSQSRGEALKASTGANKIVYVTSLRRGSDRVVSQWAHEVKHDRFTPSVDDYWSNESLQEYLKGGPNQGKAWHGKNSPSQRNNLQVAQLASMNNTQPDNVTREDLEEAKRVLMGGNNTWLIGFTDCMDKVHERLMLYGDELFGSVKRKVLPQDAVHHYSSSAEGIVLNEETSAMLKEYTSFDNELFEWAWGMAATDSRFAGTC